jgi:hypothetical protein
MLPLKACAKLGPRFRTSQISLEIQSQEGSFPLSLTEVVDVNTAGSHTQNTVVFMSRA